MRLIVALLALVALAACGRIGHTNGSNVLRISDTTDPSSLNPLLAHDQDTIGYDLLVTQTLIGLSADNRLTPELVTRVPSRTNGDISPDGKRIVYHLRRDVRFADGEPFTSGDVAFTYRAIVDPRNPVETQDTYRAIASLTTPDPHTVVVELHRPWNAAVAELFAQADFAFGILPAHAFSSTELTRADWNQHPFGTGPFRVVEWERGNRIVLARNPYYRPRPRLDGVTFEMMPTTESALTALRSGDVDVVEVAPGELPDARGIPSTRTLTTPVNGEYILIVQTAMAPTNEVEVRRAIAAALDPRLMVRGRTEALSPADSFLPPVFPWHVDAMRGRYDNAALVARSLRAAGFLRTGPWWMRSGEPLSVTIDYQADRGAWLPTIAQEQLRRTGIEATLKSFAPAQFNGPGGPLRSQRFQLAQSAWIGAADPEQSVIFACSQQGANGNNNSAYCNPYFDALFANQAVTASIERRAEDFRAMQQMVAEDLPIVPIAFMSDVDVVAERVHGFRRNMLMYPVDAERWFVSP
jgi:peptide/nickel transport system substrate-binding protein